MGKEDILKINEIRKKIGSTSIELGNLSQCVLELYKPFDSLEKVHHLPFP